jgi:hypothetical protein
VFQTLYFVVNVLNVFQSTPLLLIMVHRWLKAIKVSFLQDLIFTYLHVYKSGPNTSNNGYSFGFH